jgi:hypothetical protein
MTHDAFDEPTSTGDLGSLLVMAKELVAVEREVKDLEALLKQRNGRATELKTQIIPDKMAEVGLSEFKTPEGDRLKVEDFVAGSLPKDPGKRAKAIETLEAMGGAGLIRNELMLTFEKSQHNEALALASELREKGFDVEVSSGVHHGVYCAFVREKLRNGEEVNAEALGIFVGRKTKVELGK